MEATEATVADTVDTAVMAMETTAATVAAMVAMVADTVGTVDTVDTEVSDFCCCTVFFIISVQPARALVLTMSTFSSIRFHLVFRLR